MNSYRWM